MPDGDNLTGRLAQLRSRYPDAQPEMVAEVVRAVLATLSGDLTVRETSLLAEVEELGRTIAAAKAEIAALRVDDISESHIPSATDELDAIVAHTAAATDAILETCETLDRVGAELTGDAATQLQDATTRIYEACSFQDITGQRITKVVATLKTIDGKVAHIMQAFGERDASVPPRRAGGRRAHRSRPAERAATAHQCDGPVGHRRAAGELRLMRRAFRSALLLSTLSLPVFPAAAETAMVAPELRIGSHPGFGRVVFDFPHFVDYRLSREGDRVLLRFAEPTVVSDPGTLPRNVTGHRRA